MLEMTQKPTRRTLNWFGVIVLVFFAAVAAALYVRIHARGVAYALIGVGALLSLLFYAVPPIRMPLYLAWTRVFFPLGWLGSHVIMAVIYYLIVTPLGRVLWLVRYDSMRRRFEAGAKTYWIKRRSGGDLSQYFRQY